MRRKTKEEIEDGRRMDSKMKIRHICKCGHTVYVPEYKEKVICNNCNETVYKNEKIEFEDKLKRQIAKVKLRELLKNESM